MRGPTRQTFRFVARIPITTPSRPLETGWRCLAGRCAASPQDFARHERRDMTYSVKELFKTLQGEGAQAGRAAVFCRFSGCNLWTGREEDRAEAICKFCDTEFVGTDGEGGG